MAFNDEYRDNDPESAPEDKELEQYGVWVKVGPEEISAEEGETIDDEYGLHDLNSEAEGTVVGDELTDEEEELLGELEHDLDSLGEDEEVTDFDLGFSEEDSEAEEPFEMKDTVEEIDEIEDLDIEDLENLPDLPGLEESDSEPTEESVTETLLSGAPESVEDDLVDIPSLEDDSEELENIDIDEDLLLDSESLDDFEELDVDTMIQEDLEELGPDEEESEIEELQLEGSEESLELSEVGFDESLGSSVEEESAGTGSVPFLEQEIEDIDLEELEQNDYGEELQELDQIQEDSGTESFEDLSSFDDLEALENDLSASSEEDELVVEQSFSPDAEKAESVEILSKIEKELLSIKSELSSLKQELSSIRSSGVSRAAAAAASAAGVSEQLDKEASEDEAASFFEEDEDETIALTGDELDNILNTADITEESGTEETAPEDEDSEEHFEDISEIEPVEELDSADDLLIDSDNILEDTVEEDLEEIELEDEETEAEEIDLDDEIDEELSSEEIDEAEILDIDIDEIEAVPDSDNLDEPEDNLGDIALDELEIDIPEDTIPEAEPSEEPSPLETIEDELLPEEEEILFEEDDEPVESLESIPQTDHPGTTDELAEELASKAAQEEMTISSDMPLQDAGTEVDSIPDGLKNEIRSVLSYMDQLLESLPEDKIQEFANSDHFEVYKRLFDELGLNT